MKNKLFDLSVRRSVKKVSVESDTTVVGDITEGQSIFPATVDAQVQTEPDKTAEPTNNEIDPTPVQFTASTEEGEADATPAEAEVQAEAAADEAEAELSDEKKEEIADTADRLEVSVNAVQELVKDIQDLAVTEEEVPEQVVKTAEIAVESYFRIFGLDDTPYCALESYRDRVGFVIARGHKYTTEATAMINKFRACLNAK